MTKRSGPRFNLIRAYCFAVIDANIILHHIFNEEEFRPKVEYFIKTSKEERIVVEVLPKTTYEVNKRISEATNEFSKVLASCKDNTQRIVRKSLSKLKLNRKLANVLERAFAEVFQDISRKHFRPQTQKSARMKMARIVECAVMMEFWNRLDDSINVEQLFRNLKDDFGQKYKEFCKKQSILMREMGAVAIDKSRIPETTKKLEEIFSKKCKIRNSSDIELLCQAVGRMYKTNKWCVLSTTDYGDMVSNDFKIRRLTLLTVCDPLYFAYRLDSKLDLALKPKSAAAKFSIYYPKFFKSTKPAGVV